MQIKLDETYAIEGDEGCIKLIKKHLITGENSRGRKAAADKIGTTRDEVVGFYGNWNQVLSAYVNKFALSSDATTAKEILTAFDKAVENVKAICTVSVPFELQKKYN